MPRSRAAARPPLVEVVWLDACSYGDEFTLVEVPAKVVLQERHSTGYLIYEDEHRIVVAQTFEAPDRTTDLIAIPAPWVLRKKGRRRKT